MRMPALPVSVRSFLFSFLPMCLVLLTSFYVVGAVVKQQIKQELKESLHRTEALLDRAKAEYEQRNHQLISILSENAGLKAGIGLLQENPRDGNAGSQIRTTIEASLQELNTTLDYDLLVVWDPGGRLIAAIVRGRGVDADREEGIESPSSGARRVQSSLIRVRGELYQAATVPVNLGRENLGSLTVGRKFDIHSWKQLGHVALVRDRKPVLTSFQGYLAPEGERELRDRCPTVWEGCEIQLAGEIHLVLPLRQTHLGEGYELLSVQSIDAAMRGFSGGLGQLFGYIGAAGFVVVLLTSTLASHSVSRPFTQLIDRLKQSERTGKLEPHFPTLSRAKEVNELAEAFNRAAVALQDSQQCLGQAYLQFTETMAQALDARDPYTAGHSDRVSRYSAAIAFTLGLPDDQVEIIRVGALLHDIGKIGVPDAVLQKPGKLTDSEFDLIKKHPQIGKRILERVSHFGDYLPILELHHEDHDGRGYPHGLSGDRIPLCARIVHVADAYDAMTSNRAYRRARSVDDAVEELKRSANAQFDPAVVAAFLTVVRPPASPPQQTVEERADSGSVFANV